MRKSFTLFVRNRRMNVSAYLWLIVIVDSDEQIREMQMSIRNISTNKKSSRLRKNYLAQKRIGDTGRGANNSKNFATALPYKHQ